MSTTDYILTDKDLDYKGQVLVEADEIKSNPEVYRAVTKHMKKKAAKINRIADIRARLEEDLSDPKMNENIEVSQAENIIRDKPRRPEVEA